MNKIIVETFLEHINHATVLDSDNILWKNIDGNIIGKRSVWTKSFKSCWIDECKKEDIKSYWCGEDADYNETFEYNIYN